MKRTERHRLSIDIPEMVYKQLRLEAIKYNCTITKYVLKALVEKFKRESSEYEPTNKVQGLSNNIDT